MNVLYENVTYLIKKEPSNSIKRKNEYFPFENMKSRGCLFLPGRRKTPLNSGSLLIASPNHRFTIEQIGSLGKIVKPENSH
jgi:hypothetical protein